MLHANWAQGWSDNNPWKETMQERGKRGFVGSQFNFIKEKVK